MENTMKRVILKMQGGFLIVRTEKVIKKYKK